MKSVGIALLTLAALAVGLYVLDPPFVEAALGPKGQPTGADAPAHGGRRADASIMPVAVRTVLAETRDVPVTEHAVGWVEPVVRVDVRPEISGTIVDQAITEGQMVAAGDLLFRLDDRAIQAEIAKDRATIAKDQAALGQAKADLERDKSLAGHQLAVTQQQIDQQQATVDADAAQVEMDRAALQADQVQLGYATLRSPIAGRAGAVNRTPGNYVQPGDQTPLVTITQMAPVRVSFAVPERDLGPFRAALAAGADTPVRVTIPGDAKPIATGRLSFVDPSVDTGSGTVTAKALFDNADGALWPGLYVKVEADLSSNPNAIVVPLVAVQESNSGPFVYVVKADQTVDRRPVTTGTVTGNDVVIASGVERDEHVVVDGQLRLSAGAKAKETLAGAPGPTASR
jgi:multidrug efflux system membrane fusion protein